MTEVAGDTAPDIRVELYVLDPEQITGSPEPGRSTEIRIDGDVQLRLLASERYARAGSPHIMSFALDFARGIAPSAVAEALWRFLKANKGGRGVVTARVMRRRERQGVDEPTGRPVTERHELWVAIPLRSNREARRRIDAFFAEVLGAPG